MSDDASLSMDDFLDPMMILQNAQKIQEYMEKGRTLQDALEVPFDRLQAKYAFAHNFISDHEHGDASNIFAYLCALNPYDSRVWISLGICRTLAGEGVAAVDCYVTATMLDSSDPYPHFYATFNYLARGDKKEGERSLGTAKMLAEAGSHEALIEKISAAEKQFEEDKGKKILKEGALRYSKAEAAEAVTSLEKQTAIRKRMMEEIDNPLPEGYPDYAKAFIVDFRDQFAGDILGFSLSFLAELVERKR